MPNANLVILTIDNCKSAHADMAYAGRTTCPVCGAELPKTVVVATEAGPQWAMMEMLKSPVKDGGKGTQMAFSM